MPTTGLTTGIQDRRFEYLRCFQYDHATKPTQLLWKFRTSPRLVLFGNLHVYTTVIIVFINTLANVNCQINNLPDLRQQQAGLKDAVFGRWQANVLLGFHSRCYCLCRDSSMFSRKRKLTGQFTALSHFSYRSLL